MKEATWILYSFNVKLQSKNACRFSDKMFHNAENTADLAGVNSRLIKYSAYLISGFCAAWAGVVLTADTQAKVEHQAVRRKSDNRILGVVGPKYHVLQNRAAFQWFQPFLDAREAALHTAGSLCEGSRVWVLAKLNRDPLIVALGDEVEKFMLLSHGHDGSLAVRVGFTPVRVVCQNTLRDHFEKGGVKGRQYLLGLIAAVILEKPRAESHDVRGLESLQVFVPRVPAHDLVIVGWTRTPQDDDDVVVSLPSNPIRHCRS
jgi:hypothetical protein